jgi:hypothetical protein
MLGERESKDKQCSGDYLEFVAVNLILLNNMVLIHLKFSDIISILSSISDVQPRTIMKESNNPIVMDIREIELLLLE